MNAQELMDSGQTFVAWHKPGNDQIVVMYPCKVRLLETLDCAKGFVFAPFHADYRHPALLFQGETWVIPLPEERAAVETPAPSATPTEDYARAFQRFSNALKKRQFKKLVLSREKQIACDYQPSEAFLRACALYPDCFTYICRSPEVGLWMGSTPEILLQGSNRMWQTVALAGTQPWSDHCQWDDKNRQEQALVADYIRDKLFAMDILPNETEPQTVRAGALAHLKTTFRFTSFGGIAQLVNALHPTPAVCGLPRDEALRFILENEGHDRGYYSGYVGTIRLAATALYVNLRCLNNHTLYAGGGLLPESTLESEWAETERKMGTMLNIMSNE